MATLPPPKKNLPSARDLKSGVIHSLGSLKLAVLLIVAVAAVLAWATFLEASKGREYAQWHVYGSRWFTGLLGLLGANILAATLVRFPWKRSQTGFVITHVGLLVLLAGSIQTFVGGLDGQLSFAEGDAEDTILLGHRSRIRILGHGPEGRLVTDLSFNPGPSDWPPDATIDFGEADGVGLKILRFYRHARREVDWVADDSPGARPALRFALTGPDGRPVGQDWLVGSPLGSEANLGPARLRLMAASADTMLQDFCEPPACATQGAGILSMHHDGKMYRVEVQENLGRKVPVGQGPIQVEIVKYLPNAKPSGSGEFTSRGDEPKEPMLELRVHLPDAKESVRKIVFANAPLLDVNSVHGRPCPVKFWYHHPATPVPSGVDFLETSDGRLHCRVGIDGRFEPRGEVDQGGEVEVSGGSKVAVLEFLPKARREVSFRPVELAPGESGGPEAAVLVEVAIGEATEQFWLQRNNPESGLKRIPTAAGPVRVAFEYERLPLDFSLKLIDFRRGLNPGRMGDASFASSVQLVDKAREVDEPHEISMNEPLVYGRYTFYQAGFDQLDDGREVSRLTVAYDPGRTLKYLGSLMICAGTFVMFFLRAGWTSKMPWLAFRRRAGAAGVPPAEVGKGLLSGPHAGVSGPQHVRADRKAAIP